MGCLAWWQWRRPMRSARKRLVRERALSWMAMACAVCVLW